MPDISPFLGKSAELASLIGYAIVLSADRVKIKKNHVVDCTSHVPDVSAPGLVGPEDITIDQETGRAYISACDRRKNRDTATPGAIFAYDVESNGRPEKMALNPNGHDFDPENFFPHGISLFKGGNGQDRLFVINKKRVGETNRSFVEIFAIDGTNRTLDHVISIGDTRPHARTQNMLQTRESTDKRVVTNLNDLVAVGRNEFYATNNGDGLFFKLAMLIGLGRSDVFHFKGDVEDGGTYTRVANGIVFANGIAIDPHSKTMYVSASRSRSLLVYKVDEIEENSRRGVLTEPFQNIVLGTSLDNIEWQDEATMLIGAHPSPFALFRHERSSDVRSPSQVLRLRIAAGGVVDTNTIEEIYRNDGGQISGSSVAAAYGGKILIGAVFERKFLACNLMDRDSQ